MVLWCRTALYVLEGAECGKGCIFERPLRRGRATKGQLSFWVPQRFKFSLIPESCNTIRILEISCLIRLSAETPNSTNHHPSSTMSRGGMAIVSHTRISF